MSKGQKNNGSGHSLATKILCGVIAGLFVVAAAATIIAFIFS
jgi:hypothetical protein